MCEYYNKYYNVLFHKLYLLNSHSLRICEILLPNCVFAVAVQIFNIYIYISQFFILFFYDCLKSLYLFIHIYIHTNVSFT